MIVDETKTRTIGVKHSTKLIELGTREFTVIFRTEEDGNRLLEDFFTKHVVQ